MRALTILIFILFCSSCGDPVPLLEQLRTAGELVVVTRNSPTTYYEGPDGPTGLEYDLVRLFARELGVKPHFVLPERFDRILPMVAGGEGHLAAAGITVTHSREKQVRFGPAYQEITQQVVYRAGNRKPRKLQDLIGGDLEVVAGSSHEEELRQAAKTYPELQWLAHRDMSSEELLYLVKEGFIDYTVADSNQVTLNRRYYQELAVGFDLTPPQKLAWAVAHRQDNSLYDAMSSFFGRISNDGTLEQLIERYYGYVRRLNFVEKRSFRRQLAKCLPRYIDLFRQAGQLTGFDWRLLAAIGYQESHWNPKAVSPTGVRGIMMLTRSTAKQLGIKNRIDPEQSILGGARYIQLLEKKIPERIQEPDRLWLALAGYNIGFGHLEDARIITQRQGGDPDKWADVKQRLPLLSKEKWYKTTRHGYARGREPVQYVDNVRSYYDLLKWIDHQQEDEQQPVPYGLSIAPAVM